MVDRHTVIQFADKFTSEKVESRSVRSTVDNDTENKENTDNDETEMNVSLRNNGRDKKSERNGRYGTHRNYTVFKEVFRDFGGYEKEIFESISFTFLGLGIVGQEYFNRNGRDDRTGGGKEDIKVNSSIKNSDNYSNNCSDNYSSGSSSSHKRGSESEERGRYEAFRHPAFATFLLSFFSSFLFFFPSFPLFSLFLPNFPQYHVVFDSYLFSLCFITSGITDSLRLPTQRAAPSQTPPLTCFGPQKDFCYMGRQVRLWLYVRSTTGMYDAMLHHVFFTNYIN